MGFNKILKNIRYIPCNPQSHLHLATDAAKLFGKGFSVERQDPFDRFCPFSDDAESYGQRRFFLHERFRTAWCAAMCRRSGRIFPLLKLLTTAATWLSAMR